MKKKTPVRKKYPSKSKTKKGLSWRWTITIGIIILLVLSPFYYTHVLTGLTSAWQWVRNVDNPNYRKYKSFNIRIPTNYKIHGIDVSSYQGTVHWDKIKSMREDSVHISFAFIKATEGLQLIDPFFKRNWREGPKNGIICGAYHFFRPEKSGKLQAAFFLKNVKTQPGDLPMTVDIEVLDGVPPEKMRGELTMFLKQVEAKTKVKPIIYTGLKFYRDNISGYFDDYHLWIAHYVEPTPTIDQTHWKFWQHSDRAKVNGISRPVDFDVFSGDSLAFQKLLVK
ncbi:MAG: glycoside hydrolase family 25 protein [Sphingobacteriales bacterium]